MSYRLQIGQLLVASLTSLLAPWLTVRGRMHLADELGQRLAQSIPETLLQQLVDPRDPQQTERLRQDLLHLAVAVLPPQQWAPREVIEREVLLPCVNRLLTYQGTPAPEVPAPAETPAAETEPADPSPEDDPEVEPQPIHRNPLAADPDEPSPSSEETAPVVN